MNGRQWTFLFLSALLLTFFVWAGLNLLVDPFGVFGDVLFSWDAYSQTLNPRIGKIEYLQAHFDEYDAYILGSSSAASYLPETLAEYTGASYYNLFHYGADIAYDAALAEWLTENDTVRHIVLVLGLSEGDFVFAEEGLTDRQHLAVTGESGWTFYREYLFASPRFALEKLTSFAEDTILPQAFDVFLPESGVYDKRLRDAEPIGSLVQYREAYADQFHSYAAHDLRYVTECAAYVAEIGRICREAGAELTVILSPASEAQLAEYTTSSLNAYFSALNEAADYWNFCISSVSLDERYFYDRTHTRNATADMVLARIYGDENAYFPESFGHLYEGDDFPTTEQLMEMAQRVSERDYTTDVPILLYHHLDPNGEEDGATLHPDTFGAHMALLKENGFTPVSPEQLIAYVEQGEALPENPVVITFDDGYYSNYEYAYPILREYGWPASFFVIGTSAGHTRYKDTEYPILPHFGGEEMAEMTEAQLSIQSHTWDMHQWREFEDTADGAVRENILPLIGEGEDEYVLALRADCAAQKELFAANGLAESVALAFPSGYSHRVANAVLVELGYKITLTTDAARVNTLVCGLPQSLLDLGRLNVAGDVSAEMLLDYCRGKE